MPAHTPIAHRLRHARAMQGISQEALAERCGVSRSALAGIEAREATPRLATVYRLAAALGCTVAWLQNGEGEGPLLNKGAAATAPESAPDRA